MLEAVGHSSHVPWLASAVAQTTGTIVEFGGGYFSTPLLHVLAGKRHVYTLESSPEWFLKLHTLNSKTHSVIITPRLWKDLSLDVLGPIGLAFVDCEPSDDRVGIIKRLKGQAQMILAHDTEPDAHPSRGPYRWEELDGLFKYKTVLDKWKPWTTAYSDVQEFAA